MRARLALISLVALATVAFVVDLGLTRAAVPETPPNTCELGDTACTAARSDAIGARAVRARELERGLGERGQPYALLMLAGTVVLAALSISRGVSSRDVANDVGVAGVSWLLITTALLIVTANDPSYVELPPAPMILAGIALVVVAAIGSFSSTLASGVATIADTGRGNRVLAVATAATLLTILMTASESGGPTTCPDPEPWTGPTLWIAVASTLAAVLCGLVLLTWRRWMVALITFVVSPVALFLGFVFNACLG